MGIFAWYLTGEYLVSCSSPYVLVISYHYVGLLPTRDTFGFLAYQDS